MGRLQRGADRVRDPGGLCVCGGGGVRGRRELSGNYWYLYNTTLSAPEWVSRFGLAVRR